MKLNLSSPQSDGNANEALVSDGSGNLSFASVAGGKVLQAVTASITSATFVYGTTFADSGLSATITPSATGSKVLVFVTQHYIVRRSSSSLGGSITLYRGSTKLTNDINGSDPYKIHLNITGATYVEIQGDFNTTYLDSPSTTSATTYKTMIGAAYGNNSALTGVSNDGTASLYDTFGDRSMTSRLIVNSIRHTGASSDAVTLDNSGNITCNGTATGFGGGKILQVVESTSSTTVTTSGGTEADLLTLSITPSSSSNKVFLFISIDVQANHNTNAKAWIRLYRGTSSGTLIRTLKAEAKPMKQLV